MAIFFFHGGFGLLPPTLSSHHVYKSFCDLPLFSSLAPSTLQGASSYIISVLEIQNGKDSNEILKNDSLGFTFFSVSQNYLCSEGGLAQRISQLCLDPDAPGSCPRISNNISMLT